MRSLLVVVSICALCSRYLYAHDLSQSTSALTVIDRQVQIVLFIDLTAIPGFEAAATSPVSLEMVDQRIEIIFETIKKHYHVESTGAPESIRLERYEVIDGHVIRLELLEKFHDPVNRVNVTSSLDRLTRPDHTHLVVLQLPQEPRRAVLSKLTPTFAFEEIPILTKEGPNSIRYYALVGLCVVAGGFWLLKAKGRRHAVVEERSLL